MLSATSGTLLHVKWAWENEVYARDSDKYACEIPTYIQGHQLRKQKKTSLMSRGLGACSPPNDCNLPFT